MKKSSKVLAFVLSSALTIGIAGSMSANAIWRESKNIPLTPPDGEVLYELDCEKGEVSYRATAGNGLTAYGFDNFRYNYISIKVKNGMNANTIAKKYMSGVDSDIYNIDGSYIYRYDNYVSGDDPRTHESVANKYKQLNEICAQMYEDGVVEEATFTPMIACYISKQIEPYISCGYLYGSKKEDFQDKVDELQAFVDDYTANGKVNIYEYGSSGTEYHISINLNDTDLDTYDELVTLRDEIVELYDYDNVDISYTSPTIMNSDVSSNTINLLDPYICDIDDNGEADISDATQILQAYAENMAGIQRAAANDKMDVNGDGEINIDDVTYVLTYYAESCAGLR